MSVQSVQAYDNREALSLEKWANKWLSKQRVGVRKGTPVPEELKPPAVLVNHCVKAPLIDNLAPRKVTLTKQYCEVIKTHRNQPTGVLSGYFATKMDEYNKPLTKKLPVVLPNTTADAFDADDAERRILATVKGETTALYGSDQGDDKNSMSLFKPSSLEGIEWSFNGLQSALSRAVARDARGNKNNNVFAHVSGLSGLVYHGAADTFSPWHTEANDFFSSNIVHFGAPKIWFCIDGDDFTQCVDSVKAGCQGTNRS